MTPIVLIMGGGRGLLFEEHWCKICALLCVAFHLNSVAGQCLHLQRYERAG